MSITYLVSYDITNSPRGNNNENFRNFVSDLLEDQLDEDDENELRGNITYSYLMGNLSYGEFSEVETTFWVKLKSCLNQNEFTEWLESLVYCFNAVKTVKGNPQITFVFIANSGNYPLGEVEPMPLRRKR